MLIRIVLGLLLLTALTGDALAGEEIERHFAHARLLKVEGKTAEAIDALQLIIREWPDDAVYTPQAHILLAESLIAAGRIDEARRVLQQTFDRYQGWEKLLAATEALRASLSDRAERQEERDEAAQKMIEAIEALWRKLKAEGLSGKELAAAFKAERKRMEAARQFYLAQKQYERVRKLWEDQGVSAEEIAKRQAQIAEARVRLVAYHAELRRLIAKFQEDGASAEAIRRGIEEYKRLHADRVDGAWKERREEEMHRIRREFIHLAEKLGIPGEAAERLLEEHRTGRSQLELGEERLHEIQKDLDDRLAEMEKRFEDMSMHMERFAHHLEMQSAEREMKFRGLEHRVADLQHRVEMLMERAEGEHEDED